MRLPGGVYPEMYEILRCLFVSLRVSAQNDRRGKAEQTLCLMAGADAPAYPRATFTVLMLL